MFTWDARKDVRLGAAMDLYEAGALDPEMPALPMRPTVRVPTDPRLDAMNALASYFELNPGMSARRRRRRGLDEDEIIANLVTGYHDYPYGSIDQIEARGCA